MVRLPPFTSGIGISVGSRRCRQGINGLTAVTEGLHLNGDLGDRATCGSMGAAVGGGDVVDVVGDFHQLNGVFHLLVIDLLQHR